MITKSKNYTKEDLPSLFKAFYAEQEKESTNTSAPHIEFLKDLAKGTIPVELFTYPSDKEIEQGRLGKRTQERNAILSMINKLALLQEDPNSNLSLIKTLKFFLST